MTGPLNVANDVWNKIGDDVQIGDINEAGTLGIQGLNGNTSIRFTTYNQTNNGTGGKISWDGANFILNNALPVGSGGTGATQGVIDITDFCTFPTGNVVTSIPYGGRLYYNPYLNCVFGTIVTDDNASVSSHASIVYLKKDSSGTPLIANRQAACGVCVHSETTPVIVRIAGDTIISSHSTTIYTPRYTIMAFLG
jgi:hypothetical protein